MDVSMGIGAPTGAASSRPTLPFTPSPRRAVPRARGASPAAAVVDDDDDGEPLFDNEASTDIHLKALGVLGPSNKGWP